MRTSYFISSRTVQSFLTPTHLHADSAVEPILVMACSVYFFINLDLRTGQLYVAPQAIQVYKAYLQNVSRDVISDGCLIFDLD